MSPTAQRSCAAQGSRVIFDGQLKPRIAAVIVLSACLAGASAPIRAETGSTVDLPLATVKMKSGLAVHVDTHWVDANGYRPIRMRLTPVPSPTTADRTIRVEVHASDRGGPRANMIAGQYIEIPQGSTGVEATISVPQRHQCFSVDLEFSENGRQLKDLDWHGSWMTGQWFWTEASPAVLFIDSDTPPRPIRNQQVSALRVGAKSSSAVAAAPVLPDVRVIASILPTWPQVNLGAIDVTQKFGDAATLTLLESYPRLAMRPPAELPERVVEYSCFDVVVISRDDLRLLITSEPKKWQALRDWIATGASLCVYDAGDDFARLGELEALLSLPPLPDEKNGPRGWETPGRKDRDSKVVGVRDVGPAYYQQNTMLDPTTGQLVNQLPTTTSTTEPPPDQAFFVSRKLGLGRVIAIGPADPFPGSAWQWGWLFNSIGAQNLMWYQRHGLSLNRENSDFWNFLIPGVGRPPVLTFLVLISLFMIAVGPVNYLSLRRQSRLYLLLVTVPAAAGLVTLSLLGYALFADGLGVRVRVRSFTQIDQTLGRAVSWSRQSYYAGVAPSRGLSFPLDTVVYPLEDHPDGRYAGRSYKTRVVEWDEQQHLASGYLSSRTTTQLVAIRSHATGAALLVRESTAAKESPRVENKLGTTLNQLLLCDANGDLHWGERIEPDAVTQLTPIEWKVAQPTFAALVRSHQPKAEEGIDYSNSGWRNYFPWNDVDRNLPGALTATSVLENQLQSLGLASNLQPKPRTYVALVKSSPEVPLGVRASQEEASFHVIAGQW